MIKNKDIPAELRKLNSAFSKLAYRHDVSRIFDDFLTIVICCMAFQTQEPLYLRTVKNYNREELDYFAQMFAEISIIYAQANQDKTWCDPLGDFYEALAGNYKKSALGQFFTPKAVCDIMAGFIINPDEFGKTINEPTCGSGRIVLAANSIAEGNYYVCQDLDPICCKMSAVNLCFHKIRAEIHCMDSLRITQPKVTYQTNYNIWETKRPYVIMKDWHCN